MKVNRKVIYLCVLTVEMVLLGLLCLERLKSHENDRIEYSADMLMMAQENEGVLEMRDGTPYIDGAVDQGTNRRIITPNFFMNRGVYAVSVQYQSVTSSVSSVGCRSQAVYDGDYPWIHSESALLTNNYTSVEYFVYVTKDNTDVRIKNIMDDGVYDPIRIDKVTVTYLNGRSAAVDAILFLIFFGIVDIILYFYLFRRQKMDMWLRKNGLTAAALCALLFIVELPMTMNYLPKGYDMRFHYYRLYTIAEGLRDGFFPVKIQPEWFNGYGYATGIFYGDLLLYFPAALYLLGFSMGTAYKSYILLINVLTIGNSYLCFKTVSKDKYIALFGTVVYSSFLHRLVALYTRAALGAFTGLAFLPLVLLGLWAIYYGEDKEYKRGWLFLVIGATGIIESHLLGTLMTVLFVVIFILFSLKQTFRKRTVLALGKAVLGCIMANLFYIVPFLDTYRSMTLAVDDYTGNKPLYYNSAFLSQLFSTSYNAIADVKEDLSGMLQDMPMSVGPVSGLVILAAVCYLIRYYHKDGNARKENGLLVKLLVLTFLSLWMSTNLFPYIWLDEYCPALYAGLKKFEFAWRFLAMASTFITLLYVALMGKAKALFGRKRTLAAGAIVCMLFCYQGADYLFQYSNLMIPFEYEDSFRDLTVRAIYDGAYLPQGTDFQKMTPQLLLPEGTGISATMTARTGTAMDIQVENPTDTETYIDLPLLHYQGYRAQSDAGQLTVSAGENNRLRVAVPEGFKGNMHVFFAEPWYWRVAEIFSLLFWFLLVGYLLLHMKNKRTERV